MKGPKSTSDPTQRLPRAGSLGQRMALIIGGVMVLLFCAFVIASSLVIQHFFSALQDTRSRERLERVIGVLGQTVSDNVRLVVDNAQWDETYAYVAGENPDYLERNYSPNASTAGQDIVLVFDGSRRSRGVVRLDDPSASALPDGMSPEQLARSPLLSDRPEAGLMVVGERVLALAAAPVRPSDSSRPPNGWLVFAQWMTPERVAKLAAVAGADFRVAAAASLDGQRTGYVFPVAKEFLASGFAAFPAVRDWGATVVESNAHIHLQPIVGSRGVLVLVRLSAAIYRHALIARNWLFAASAFCGLVCLAVGIAAMQRSIIRPLVALDREMATMAHAENASGSLSVTGDGEIGRLAASANLLLERVMAGRREAQEQKTLLAGVLDSTSDGITALHCCRDADGQIVDMEIVTLNRAAEEMLHASEDELVGQSIQKSYPLLVKAGIYGRWLHVVESRESITFEICYEGHRIAGWFHYACAPWGDGVVVSFRDISEEKARQKELADSYAEMERFNAAMIGREERIIEMKREVNALRARLDLPPTYEVSDGEH